MYLLVPINEIITTGFFVCENVSDQWLPKKRIIKLLISVHIGETSSSNEKNNYNDIKNVHIYHNSVDDKAAVVIHSVKQMLNRF